MANQGSIHLVTAGGISTSATVEDLIKKAGKATRNDNEGRGTTGLSFIKTTLNPKDYFRVNQWILGFQSAKIHVESSRNVYQQPYVTLTIDSNGDAEIKSACFSPDEDGICTCYIPDTKKNREILIEMMSAGDLINVEDEAMKKALSAPAKKKADDSKAKERKMLEEAIIAAETFEAVFCKTMAEKFGEAFRSAKEYKDVIEPLVAKNLKEIKAREA